jgi:VanZ family protein
MRPSERATWSGFVLLSAVGLFGLLLPLADLGGGARVLLNLAHVPLFALWTAWLFLIALQRAPARGALRLTLLLASAVALGSEAMQSVLPSRQSDVRDVFSNLAGVGLGVAFSRWRWRQRFRKPGAASQ